MAHKFAIVWLSLSTVVVVFDAAFVLLRPRTLPGGDLHHIFQLYDIYLRLDSNYGDITHTFTIAQSWANLFEVSFNMAAVTLLLRGNKGGVLCSFFVNTLTCYKTVLYLIQYLSLCNGAHLVAHLSLAEWLFFYSINGVWVLIPGYFVLTHGRQLLSLLRTHTHSRQKKD